MSANVGLSTPRGSGTSGYVQRNHAHLRPRDQVQPYPKGPDLLKHKQRQPDKQILAHERAREVEVKVFDLRDKLEEEGVDDEEIEDRCAALRKKLTAAQTDKSGGSSGKSLKKHQVHEMAAAKIQESERLRRALGISKDYEEGSHWKKQEERLREATYITVAAKIKIKIKVKFKVGFKIEIKIKIKIKAKTKIKVKIKIKNWFESTLVFLQVTVEVTQSDVIFYFMNLPSEDVYRDTFILVEQKYFTKRIRFRYILSIE